MIDLKLYMVTGEYADDRMMSEMTQRLLPSDKTARGIEVIAGKVVKFLKTSLGSDALYGDRYGGTAFQHTQIADTYEPQFVLEVNQDIERCELWIKEHDTSCGVTGERLSTIILRDVMFPKGDNTRGVDVYMEIVTNLGHRAVVCVNSRTDG